MRERGLTLIEVLVAMGIATAVGALLVVIMVNSAGLFSKQSSKVQAGLNINDALSQIRSSIKQANAVASEYISGQTTYTTGGNQLVLKVSSVDSSGNIINNTVDYFVFFQDQSYLRFKTFPDPSSSRKESDRIFSTAVDSLNFQYFNSANPPVEVTPVSATKVRISLTLKQKIGLNFEVSTATSEANLRND
ncbi:MAG: type II secretion system protein [Candidatus Daviesbacteria bacterium]|nr:type II secretion system protein [Candidatus Daviesbacteria bacterium]